MAVGLAEAEAEAMRPATELTEAEKEKLRKERERREDGKRRAWEEEKRAEQKAKQASILKGFFAAAPKRPAVPESNVVTAPLVPVTEKGEASEEAERAYAEAVRSGNTVAVETLRAETLARWKRTKFSRDANEDANEDRAAHSAAKPSRAVGGAPAARAKRRRGADAADPLRAALESSAPTTRRQVRGAGVAPQAHLRGLLVRVRGPRVLPVRVPARDRAARFRGGAQEDVPRPGRAPRVLGLGGPPGPTLRVQSRHGAEAVRARPGDGVPNQTGCIGKRGRVFACSRFARRR